MKTRTETENQIDLAIKLGAEIVNSELNGKYLKLGETRKTGPGRPRLDNRPMEEIYGGALISVGYNDINTGVQIEVKVIERLDRWIKYKLFVNAWIAKGVENKIGKKMWGLILEMVKIVTWQTSASLEVFDELITKLISGLWVRE